MFCVKLLHSLRTYIVNQGFLLITSGRVRWGIGQGWCQVSSATGEHISRGNGTSSPHSALHLVSPPGEFKEPIFTSWRTMWLFMALETGCYVNTQHEITSFETKPAAGNPLPRNPLLQKYEFPSFNNFLFPSRIGFFFVKYSVLFVPVTFVILIQAILIFI